MADQVHDAGLDDGLGKDGVDRLGKALQSVDDGDQDIADAAALQLVHDAQPELGALGLLDPDAKNLLRAIGQDAERNVYGLVPDEALVPDLDPDRLEKDERVADVERPVLPFGNLLQDGIGDSRDQVRRYVDTIEFFQMAADLAHRHAAHIAYMEMILSSKSEKRR
ncbi:hypothetical protein X726_32400 [Mesorhizobium sp. L103C105A0]|nr:hypothetical protein X726_32400 [Mesorhizobium sp. L103C105A0]